MAPLVVQALAGCGSVIHHVSREPLSMALPYLTALDLLLNQTQSNSGGLFRKDPALLSYIILLEAFLAFICAEIAAG